MIKNSPLLEEKKPGNSGLFHINFLKQMKLKMQQNNECTPMVKLGVDTPTTPCQFFLPLSCLVGLYSGPNGHLELGILIGAVHSGLCLQSISENQVKNTKNKEVNAIKRVVPFQPQRNPRQQGH